MLLPKGIELFPLDNENPDKAFAFASKEALGKIYWLQSHINPFLQEAPMQYFVCGHMGHGCNTYNLYVSRADEWSKIFLRLGIGGVYMDNDRQAKLIREFLPKYFAFEEKMRYHSHLVAVDSGSGLYRVSLFNGKTYELRESLFRNPDFSLIFKEGEENEIPLL